MFLDTFSVSLLDNNIFLLVSINRYNYLLVIETDKNISVSIRDRN